MLYNAKRVTDLVEVRVRRARCLGVFLLVVFCAGLMEAQGEFRTAVPGRVLSFPQDHGKHPDFQTEWWYFTGNLQSEDGSSWGFQLTFFRRSMTTEPATKQSAWGVRDVYLAHFAISSLKEPAFFHTELISREGPGLAEASTDGLNVRIKNWSAFERGDNILIRADDKGYGLELAMIPEKPPVLHGEAGYSRKGDKEGQASYYYSFSRLRSEGQLTFNGATYRVSGLSWMDHEFGSSILHADQAGWDWFCIQLDDGTDLMLFHLRKKDGSFEPTFGTLVRKDGIATGLRGRPITIRQTSTWTSARTKAVYPSGWIIELPAEGIRLSITPALLDQELITEKSSRVTYWEGSVTVSGTRNGQKIEGRGYVELTGYAHSIGGRI